jgi:hypothetical protein
MRSVCICGSRRYTKEIRAFAKKLRKSGVTVYEPFLNKNIKISDLPSDLKRYSFLGLTLHHFNFIRKADAVYFYNKDGYIGVSCSMELGFAEALGKPIFALSDKDPETARAVLFDNIVKTPRELVKILK